MKKAMACFLSRRPQSARGTARGARRSFLAGAASLAVMCACSLPLRAGLVIEALNSTATPGGTGSFDVVLFNNSASGSFGVTGFSVELTLPTLSGISFTGVNVNTAAPYIFGTYQSGMTPFSANTFPNQDFVAGDQHGTASVHPGDTFGLAHVSYLVAPGTALGPVDVSLGARTSLHSGEVPVPFTKQDGTITVTDNVAAVPEPAPLLLLVIGMSCWVSYRWVKPARGRLRTHS
jgi:hypothetical protein